jgi:hypothetical protein
MILRFLWHFMAKARSRTIRRSSIVVVVSRALAGLVSINLDVVADVYQRGSRKIEFGQAASSYRILRAC